MAFNDAPPRTQPVIGDRKQLGIDTIPQIIVRDRPLWLPSPNDNDTKQETN